MNTRILAVLLIFSLLTSCGTTSLSTKELSEINTGNRAILKTYNQPLIGAILFEAQPVTQIVAVDGKKISSEIFRTDESLAIDTGIHQVEFHCTNRSGVDERDYSEVVEIDFKPYHEYRVRCSFDTDFGPDGTYTGSFSIKETRIK